MDIEGDKNRDFLPADRDAALNSTRQALRSLVVLRENGQESLEAALRSRAKLLASLFGGVITNEEVNLDDRCIELTITRNGYQYEIYIDGESIQISIDINGLDKAFIKSDDDGKFLVNDSEFKGAVNGLVSQVAALERKMEAEREPTKEVYPDLTPSSDEVLRFLGAVRSALPEAGTSFDVEENDTGFVIIALFRHKERQWRMTMKLDRKSDGTLSNGLHVRSVQILDKPRLRFLGNVRILRKQGEVGDAGAQLREILEAMVEGARRNP